MGPLIDPWRKDPWGWTIEQAVTWFCDETFPFRTVKNSEALPDASLLAQKLREHCIEGASLLTEINHVSLRDEFGLRVLGQRGNILREINQLRKRSQEYSDYIQNQAPNPSSGYCAAGFDTASIYSRPSLAPVVPASPLDVSSYVNLQPIGHTRNAWQPGQPVLHNGKVSDLATSYRQSLQWLDQLPIEPEPLNVGASPETRDELSEHTKNQEQSQTLRVSEPFPNEADIVTDSSKPAAPSILLPPPEKTADEQTPLMQNETIIIDKNGNKRRRLVLTTAAPTDLDRQVSALTGGTNSCNGHNGQQPAILDGSPRQNNAANIEEQETTTMVLQELPDETQITSTVSPDKIHEIGDVHLKNTKPEPLLSTQSRGYLGTKAVLVDDIFYERDNAIQKLSGGHVIRTIPDDDEQGSDNFFFTSTAAGDGQRRYFKSRIHYFLRQEVEELRRGNKFYLGIRPYPDRLMSRHQPLSITIFEPKSDHVLATRKDRAQWTSNDPLSLLGQRPGSPEADDLNVPISPQEANDDDWAYLEKWNHISGHNDVLPIYGDSGSEGEYDLDTWREIEKEEGGKLARPLGRSKQIKKLDAEEVVDAIDDAIKSMIEVWKDNRLPRLLRTAWRLWSKSRRDRTKQIQISALSSDVQHLNHRFDKLRKEIANEKWTSTARVKRQCESMRRTIYDLQDSEWKISMLQLKKRPEKPQELYKSQTKKTNGNQALQEDLNRDTDTSMVETSSGEDLDGFIVDDEESMTANEDVTMMDGADNDATKIDKDSETGDGSCSMDESSDDEPMCNGNSSVDVATTTQDEAPLQTMEMEKPSPKVLKEESSSQPQARVRSPVDVVDLTLDSDASESEAPPHRTTAKGFTSASPSIPPNHDDEDPFQRSQRKKAMFKVPPNLTHVVDLENDSAYDSAPEMVTPPKLPSLDDWKGISEIDPMLLIERADRKRLLIYILARVDLSRRKNAYKYIRTHDLITAQDGIWRSIKSILGYRNEVIGTESKEESKTLKDITAWFIEWTNVVIINKKNGGYKDYFQVAFTDKEGFEPFYNFIHELRCLVDFKLSDDESKSGIKKRPLEGSHALESSPMNSQTTPSKQKRTLLEYSDGEESPSSNRKNKKRKYAVPESQEAADIRKKAHERVAGRDERQRRLKQSLQKMGQTEDDPSKVAVNLGKLDNQELIFFPTSIGERIQPHQKDGVRFLWREIIEDHASKQGCLLAQTMGLGKTMQIISFLVLVAEASKSPNRNIRNQIPRRLRESKTLVLCPPSLIENWYEEFLKWGPEDLTESIGDIRQVSSSMSLEERLQAIEEWGAEGGILLIGYQILTTIIDPSLKKPGAHRTELDLNRQHAVTDILLTKPRIVIADEAHMAKNRESKLNKIFSRFKTGSRIAMTGSPLSNNLSEYYALIEWVAPGYLGEHREFVAHYEEPINAGLYQDSAPSVWRKGLKKLELFKREVQPKIHRADLSALASRLKGKSEFVIKVPLTPLQEELYRTFVDSMGEKFKEQQDSRSTTLWALVDVLRLVCNHPKCFYDKVTKTQMAKGKKQNQKQRRASIDNQDVELEDLAPEELGITADAAKRQLKPFEDWQKEQHRRVPLDSLSLAYKMELLMQIIKHSKAAGDKVLVFSHSLLTLNYITNVLTSDDQKFLRLDGSVPTAKRQAMTKKFNEMSVDILLISTKAGGTGLNLYGANRVIILDDNFNPTWEEQAIGRAYRIGQTKHVYVYRLTTGGTFEEALHNQSLFKQQLATRAVDQRNIARLASRSADYFRPLEHVEQKDLGPFKGKDPDVLDKILASQDNGCFIRNIVPCETFQQEVEEKLTDEEQKEVEREEQMSRLRRTDPAAYQAKVMANSAPSNFQPSQNANAAAGGMPTRIKIIGPKPPNQTVNPEVSGGIAGSPLVLPDAPKTPSEAEELPDSSRILFNPGPQGFQLTAPVMSNGAVLPHQDFGPAMNSSDSVKTDLMKIFGPPPQQQTGPVKYYLPKWV